MDCKSPACLSQCIQTHWPGILDPEKEEEEEDESWSFNDNLVTVNQRSTPTIQNEPSDTVFTGKKNKFSLKSASINRAYCILVHTTVIRLTTVTPIANTMSATSPAFKSNTVVSLGSKAIINPILAIICMTTVYLSIFGSRYVQINPFM